MKVRQINGRMVAGENIYSSFGASGLVIQSGQANIDIVVNGSSQPEGRFIDSTSMSSETFAVIQDSYYYQRFSYSIASPMQQVQFEDFVQDIVHPSGFKMFSDFRFTESVSTPSSVIDVSFGAEEDYTIYQLLITQDSTEIDPNYVWTQSGTYIALD